jgi:Domain of unknown function (DUF4159)
VNRRSRLLSAALVVLIFAAGSVFAQDRGRRGGRGYGGGRGWYGGVPGEITDRRGVPDWEVDPHFKSDLFTFVRVKFSSYGRGNDWLTDWPDSDLNFPWRLQQLTSLKVDPKPKVVELTDDALFDYPWLYMIEPGSLTFSEEEVVALRRYLLNGGFLMVDDFWGADEWENFYQEIKRVFPDREPIELPLDHKIFTCVYPLKEKVQVPSIHSAQRGNANMTWERPWDPTTREVHYKGIFDDKNRMMAIICHNTDLGDGWEREGEDEWYFRTFSEPKSYPMGINIVYYAMTH